MKKTQIVTRCGLFLCTLLSATLANASVILFSDQSTFTLGDLGGSNTTVTSQITSAGNSITNGSYTNSSLLAASDALWLSTGNTGTFSFSTTQQNILQSYIDSGKKVVIHGEHGGWSGWNQAIVSLLGGTWSSASSNGNTAIANTFDPLTNGISSLYIPSGSSITSGSRTDLTGTGTFSVWGPTDNVLLILDGNWLQNGFITRQNNNAFASNIGTWLATDSIERVPAPSTIILFALGLVGLGLAKRKKA